MAMTRRRTVTPEAYAREELISLPPEVRLTEISLRLYADDHGRERVNARLMLASFYPMDEDKSERTIEEHLLMLDDAGCLILYDLSGSTFYAMAEWPTIDRPKPSRHPEPPPVAIDSRRPRDSFVAGERESERGGAGERGPARTDRDADHPPSPFCTAHQASGGTEEPCRSCGRARLQRKVWDDERMIRVRFREDETNEGER